MVPQLEVHPNTSAMQSPRSFPVRSQVGQHVTMAHTELMLLQDVRTRSSAVELVSVQSVEQRPVSLEPEVVASLYALSRQSRWPTASSLQIRRFPLSTKEGGSAASNRLLTVGRLRMISGVEGTNPDCDSADVWTVGDGNSTFGASANNVAIQQHREVALRNNCNTAVTERAVACEYAVVAS